MAYLSIAGSAILITLIALCITKYGLKSCLSEYYYSLGWKFMVMLISGAALLVPTLIDILPENFKVLGFLCGAALMFVGAAPDYNKGGVVYKTHSIAAVLSALCGIAISFVMNNWIVLVAATTIAAILILIKKTRKSWLLWCELVAFSVVIIIDLLYNL